MLFTEEDKKGVGRPTRYTHELAKDICEKLSQTTDGLAKVAKTLGLTPSAVWRWLATYAEFRDLYARARAFQTELLYDDMLEIANAPMTHNGKPEDDPDDPGVRLSGAEGFAEMGRRKLIIDVMKFRLVKLQPDRFGNKDQTPAQAHRGNMTPEQFHQLLLETKKANKGSDYTDFEES